MIVLLPKSQTRHPARSLSPSKLYSIGVPIKFPFQRQIKSCLQFRHVQPYMMKRQRQVELFSVLHKT